MADEKTVATLAEVALSDISPDRDMWARTRLFGKHVQSLMTTPQAWPPILLRRLSEGAYPYQVVDGFHRLEAAKRLNMMCIQAHIEDIDYTYAIARAMRENLHGKPLTTAEIEASEQLYAVVHRRVQQQKRKKRK